SIEHAVSVTLLSGADALTYTLSADARVRALCKRVDVRPSGNGWQATVEVLTHDGVADSATVDGPTGHGTREASDSDLAWKWGRLTGLDGSPQLARLATADDSLPLRGVASDLFATCTHILEGGTDR